MPWSNQNGGGPWGGGGNQGGPWGQGPQGPRGPQGGPPDLEDIIRRGQDRLKRALPGGGANPIFIGLVVVGLVVLWGFKAVYTVQPDELGVELRFGKPKNEISQPGLHFHWWPIETVEFANTAEKLVHIGTTGGGSRATSGQMLSGDQNIVDVQFTVSYVVSDPKAYLFDVENPDGMLQFVAESAMREVVGRRPAQDVFRDDRQGIASDVRGTIQTTLDEYGAGLTVNSINIEDAAPPREVADAFDEVQRAEQDEDRFVEESNQYSNQKLGQARGEAAQVREEAAAYKNRVVQEARGEAQRFISVYDEYAKAPEVTRKRLFLETMEGVLKDSNKVIIEKGGTNSGVVPYLPLNELQKNQGGSTKVQDDNTSVRGKQ
jgi:membrane protease subunit HflK